MTTLNLEWIAGNFSIYRWGADAIIPSETLTTVLSAEFFSITRTDTELSIVAPSELQLDAEKDEDGWCAFRVVGTLDFGLTGILARLAHVLAEVEISIFAISTFDTDYIMIKEVKRDSAETALTSAGYQFI